jgi:hypothetical protein
VHPPPSVSDDDAAAAVERIRARRAKIDDPQLYLLPDDVPGVLDYLRKYGGGLPPDVARADLEDAAVLRLWLGRFGDRFELWMLGPGRRRAGATLTEMAPLLGLKTRQAVYGRRKWLRTKLSAATNRPEPLTRRDRDEHEAAQDWLTEHSEDVLAAAQAITAHRALGEESAQEWLDEAARVVAGDARVTPGVVQTLRFAAEDLAGSPGVRAVPADHPVHAALGAWAQLYDRYQAATSPRRGGGSA